MLIKKYFLLFLIPLLTMTACTIATVRTLDEDEEAKLGFNPDDYVESIWSSLYMPTVMDNAVDVNTIIEGMTTNRDETIAAHGNRSGSGAHSFLVSGEARVITVDTESRIGLMAVDFPPFDGEPNASITIGPVIRRTNIAATDAVGFIRFNDFVNQTEFASVSDAIKNRIVREVIEPLDLPSLTGQTIRFIGAVTIDNVNNMEIVPLMIEVQS